MHKKIENLLALDTQERYDYFIREAVQFEEVWTIANSEGYIIFKDKEQDEIFSIWPHKELAERCMFNEHKEIGASVEKINIESFLDNCIPDMIIDNVLFGVFYNAEREGLAVKGETLIQDLKSEYDEIWGD